MNGRQNDAVARQRGARAAGARASEMDVYVLAVPANEIHVPPIGFDERGEDLAEDALHLLLDAVVHPVSLLLTRYHKLIAFAHSRRSDRAGEAPAQSPFLRYSPSRPRMGRACTCAGLDRRSTKVGGPEKEKLVRYRLRFVLQELDLPVGGTIIGRSLDCHLTLEDPLVSRRHARIVVDEAGARIEDMGSRNGVRVNGAVIQDPVSLRNGDRVRIGTHDFVFCSVDPSARAHSKTTGHLRLCANCRLPYPRELLACPNCEATEQTDDDTLTGSGRSNSHGWSVQLVVESLERALKLGRVPDAERIVQRAIAQVEELLVTGGVVDGQALATLATHAVSTTLASRDPAWAHWVMNVYGRTRRVPSIDLVERLAEVAAQLREHRGPMREAVNELLRRIELGNHRPSGSSLATANAANGDGGERVGTPSSTDQEAEAIGRLVELRRSLEVEDDGPSGAGPGPGPRSLPTA
jgi:hypothetical protein